MAEIKNVETKNVKVWTPNQVQKDFMGALSKDNFLSLKQVELRLGKKVATGAINTLKSKELTITEPDIVEYTATIVETRTYANGDIVVIEKTKNGTETGYKLA